MSNPTGGDGTEKQGSGRPSAASRSQGLAYQGAFEAVVAILIASGIGLWADSHFGTSPRYLLIGTAVGFGSFVLRLVRLGRRLQELAAEQDSDAKPPR